MAILHGVSLTILSSSDNWWNTPKCFDPEHNSSEAYIKYHKEHNDTKTAVEEYWE